MGEYSWTLKWQWRVSPTPCLIVPLGVAQGGQGLLVADVCRAERRNLSNTIEEDSENDQKMPP